MFESIDEIKAYNESIGSYWFEPASMRFFDSRVMSQVFPFADGAFFVSSERCDGGPRRYTVRVATKRGITTHGSFNTIPERRQALRKAKAYADEMNS
jgi:hypothetical protein